MSWDYPGAGEEHPGSLGCSSMLGVLCVCQTTIDIPHGNLHRVTARAVMASCSPGICVFLFNFHPVGCRLHPSSWLPQFFCHLVLPAAVVDKRGIRI